jgi:ABC-type enterochelin transport system substrate-binding protein
LQARWDSILAEEEKAKRREQFEQLNAEFREVSNNATVKKLAVLYINVNDGKVEDLKAKYAHILRRLPKHTEFMFISVYNGQTRLEICDLE